MKKKKNFVLPFFRKPSYCNIFVSFCSRSIFHRNLECPQNSNDFGAVYISVMLVITITRKRRSQKTISGKLLGSTLDNQVETP